MQPPKQYICTISKIKQETPTVRTFRLDLPPGETIDFVPGQFVIVSFAHAEEQLLKLKRSYSISNQPKNNRFVEITLDSHGPFTQKMFTLQEDDQLKIHGPFGKFTLQNNAQGNICLIAGGTGIVPLMSMLRHITDNDFPNKVALLYSVKIPDEIIYRKEIEEREKKYDNFKFFPTVTRLGKYMHWYGRVKRIDKEFILESVPDISERTTYICGPNEFVRAMIDMLQQLGVPEEKIKREIW